MKDLNNLTGKALVVDDEDDFRNILMKHLSSFGLDVNEAENGETALKQIRLQKYDYIFTDYKMPDMNGDIFIRKLFKESQKLNLRDTKLIMITGQIPSAEMRWLVGEITDAVLEKPVSRETLYSTLKSLIP